MNTPVYFCYVDALGSKQMPPSTCNKCKLGVAHEGDSWCIGCSGLELSQSLLREKWKNPGLRQITEELLLTSARLCKAFHNLDQGLGAEAAGCVSEQLKTAAPKTLPNKGRVSPHRSKETRAPSKEESSPRPEPSRKSEHRSEPLPTGETEESYSEEEECSREEKERTVRRTERSRSPRDSVRKPQRSSRSLERGGRRSERYEDRYHYRASPERVEVRGIKGKATKERDKEGRSGRGGTKHQRFHEGVNNPLRRSHRRLRDEQVELAATAAEGFQRQA